MTFEDLVAAWRMTCAACPTQYEGTLADGRHFYFRYRFGRATLGIGDNPEAAIGDPRTRAIDHGDGLDGSLGHDEFKRLFVELAAGGER